MTQPHPNGIAIVGGGIMGLSIAYRLIQLSSSKNLTPPSITVIDDNHYQTSASSQAAGILATHGAQHFLSPLRRQIVKSIRSYPEFFSGLNQLLKKNATNTIESVGYRPLVHYHLYDKSPEQATVLEKRLRRLHRERAERLVEGIEQLPPDALLSMLSESDYFSTEITGLRFNSHTVEPTALLSTLQQAGEVSGVIYLTGKVIDISDRVDRRNTVILKYKDGEKVNTILTDKVVLATGSETEEILHLINTNTDEKVFPRQLYKLKNLSGAILVTEPFLNDQLKETGGEILLNLYDKKYLLHKKNRALFGSYDYKESEATTSPKDKEIETALQDDLIRLFPSLAPKPPQVLGLLTGKRLYYHDKLPLLGYLTPSIFIATALYKSGLALAPLYSRLTAEVLLHNKGAEEIKDMELAQEINYLSPLREKGGEKRSP